MRCIGNSRLINRGAGINCLARGLFPMPRPLIIVIVRADTTRRSD